MLAKRFPSILPPLTFEEAIETTQVHSVAGVLPKGTGILTARPFRAPHHTISDAGLLGGGSGVPRPGEVSLAHQGSCFSTSCPSFKGTSLNCCGNRSKTAPSAWPAAI